MHAYAKKLIKKIHDILPFNNFANISIYTGVCIIMYYDKQLC